MNKFKQCAYTVILIITCFIASPFIFHQIWKSSAEAKKPNDVPPPPVSSDADPKQDTPPENGQPAETGAAQPQNGAPVQEGETQPATEASKEPDFYVESDLSYFDNALFIGDSRTVGIKEYGSFKQSDFFCDQGLAASQINNAKINGMTFDEAIDAKQYGKVYVMLGINEVANDYEYTITAYRAIVEKLKVHQPDAVIYVQANLHVSSYAEDRNINNASIDRLNDGIASLADNKKVFYIDINKLYDDENGYFNANYTSDGVHPLAMYYTQWCDFLCKKTVPADMVTTSPAASEAASEPASAEPAAE